jgi:hypothetical protein
MPRARFLYREPDGAKAAERRFYPIAHSRRQGLLALQGAERRLGARPLPWPLQPVFRLYYRLRDGHEDGHSMLPELPFETPRSLSDAVAE